MVVAPGADLMRGVDTLAGRVVGQEQRAGHTAQTDRVGEEAHPGDGQRLVGRRACRGALRRAAVAGFERLEQRDLVAARMHEDGAIPGGRDVPLQSLEDQGARDPRAGCHDVRVDLLSTPILACIWLP